MTQDNTPDITQGEAKLHLKTGPEVHPIIRENAKNIRHFFNREGTFVEMFDGIDGMTYAGLLEPRDWTSEIWALYKKEGITVHQPVPVEEIVFPEEIAQPPAEEGGES